MDATVQRLLESGIAPSTTSAYRSAHRRFTSFCSAAGLVPFPLKEATVCRFVAHLFQNNLSSGTIRLYLSGLRFYQIASGGDNPCLDSCSRLHYVLRGVAQSQPVCSRPTHFPVTTEVLDLLFQAWSTQEPSFETTMLWAACTLGFYGFLRSGEFTVVQGRQQHPLTLANVRVDSRFDPNSLEVTLQHSKTDIHGRGCTLYIGRLHTSTCAVLAVLGYLAIRPATPGPLFIHRDGLPLTRAQLVSAIRSTLQISGMDISRYSGHSFRVGAATAAARAGLPDSLIQTLGRWKSSAFL